MVQQIYNLHVGFRPCVHLGPHSCYRGTGSNHSSTTGVYSLVLRTDQYHSHHIAGRSFSRLPSIWTPGGFSPRDDTWGRTSVLPCRTRLHLGKVCGRLAGRYSIPYPWKWLRDSRLFNISKTIVSEPAITLYRPHKWQTTNFTLCGRDQRRHLKQAP